MVPSTPTHPRVRRLAWPLLAVAAAALTALVASGPLRSYDLWWHLAYGENVLDGLGLARVDSFSYTIPGTPVTNFQWLSQVVFAFVFRHGGVAGLVALRAGVLGLVPACRNLHARNGRSAWIGWSKQGRWRGWSGSCGLNRACFPAGSRRHLAEKASGGRTEAFSACPRSTSRVCRLPLPVRGRRGGVVTGCS